MTESQWLDSTYAHAMLDFLRGTISDRKLRLFTCACCRQVWEDLRTHRSRTAVEVAERYVDGEATDQEFHRARSGACEAAGKVRAMIFRSAGFHLPLPQYAHRISFAAQTTDPQNQFLIRHLGWINTDEVIGEVAPSLLRCLAGNPFRLSRCSPDWLTSDVLAIASAAYQDRSLPKGHLDNLRLAILADALEEAGCDEAPLLAHLRADSIHVRGCWPVDFVLGKR